MPSALALMSTSAFSIAAIASREGVGEALDDAGQPLRAIAFHVFRPAGDALVSRDLQKGIDPPAGVAMQVFDLGDFHGMLPSRTRPACAARPCPLNPAH